MKGTLGEIVAYLANAGAVEVHLHLGRVHFELAGRPYSVTSLKAARLLVATAGAAH